MTGDYSKTPLQQKLGLKDGDKLGLINIPPHYFELFPEWPKVAIVENPAVKKDCIHCFVTRLSDLEKLLPVLRQQIEKKGCIWISWPKKASRQPTDVTEDVIRTTAIKNGLVDIKVCAIDDTWSGLKLVNRRES